MVNKRLRLLLVSLLFTLGILVTQPWSAPINVLATEGRQPPAVVASPDTRTAQSPSANLLDQGEALYNAGCFPEAAALYTRAARDYASQGAKLQQAAALSNLALTQSQLGQRSEANQTLQESLGLLQSQASTTEQRQILAQTLDIQGRHQFAQGQPDAALASWQQSAKIYTQLNNRVLVTRSRINQAQSLQALGLYRRARSQLSEIAQTLQTEPDTALKAIGLRSLGNVLRVTGDLEQSRKMLEQSLTVVQSLGNLPEVGNTLLDLGNTARAQRDIPAALQFYQQAATSPSLRTRTEAQLNQLSLFVEQRQLNQIQALLPQLQTQLQQLPLSRSTIYARINFAENLSRLAKETIETQKQPPSAVVQLLETTVQQAKALGDTRGESYALGTLGMLYESAQQETIAKEFTQQALLKAQVLNAPEIGYRWQWQLGRLLRKQGNLAQAIAAYDVALQTLQSLRFDLVAMNPDVQFSFRESVEPVYRQYVELLLSSGNVAQGDLPQGNLLKARTVIESLQIAEVNNFLREACLEPKESIDRVVDQTNEAAVIYPIILADRLEVILTLPQQPLRHHRIAIAQQDVNNVLDDLQQNLRKPHTLQQVQALTEQVYNWLIRPIEVDLAKSQVKTLVFVLDGDLQTIPMAALYDGKQYLVEKYSLALTPSLQLLDPKPLRQVRMKALAAGVSDARPPQFSSLPNVPIELKNVGSEVPSRILLNQEFTTQNLQQQVSTQAFPIVHFATHGQFSSNAEETFIMAWDKPIKMNDLNRLLRVSNQKDTDAIELLVLSACQTATGNRRAALGIAGVAVRAGARSTLASLWNVNDASTAQLMSQFYQVLQSDRVTKAEALRQAQLTLLKDPKYQRPMFWAPYILLGNWL
jgi:CHAT domain-containing protein